MQYQLATAYALNGRTDEALDVLERVARMGFVYPAAKDENLSSLRESPRFAAIVERFASNTQPTGNPVLAFTLEQSGLIPEGLAWDPASQRHFVSSVRRRLIYAIDRRGHASLFASKLAFGAFGMKVDGQRHVLWVAAGEIPANKAAVLKLDLKTGRTLATYQPSDSDKHLFGDLAVAPNGDVFVSDRARSPPPPGRRQRLAPRHRRPLSSQPAYADRRAEGHESESHRPHGSERRWA
jgi:hypothetical protein